MAAGHMNVLLVKRLDLGNTAAASLFAPDVFWRFSPRLPDVGGGYAEVKGIRTFFEIPAR